VDLLFPDSGVSKIDEQRAALVTSRQELAAMDRTLQLLIQDKTDALSRDSRLTWQDYILTAIDRIDPIVTFFDEDGNLQFGSPEELVSLFRNEGGFEHLNAEDVEWLTGVISRAKEEIAERLTETIPLEKFYLEQKAGNVRAISDMTIEETVKALAFGDRPVLTPAQAFRYNQQLSVILQRAGDLTETEKTEAWTRDILNRMSEINAEREASIQGMVSLGFPEIGMWRQLYMGVVSPAILGLEAVQAYSKYYVMPWAAAVLIEGKKLNAIYNSVFPTLALPQGDVSLGPLAAWQFGLVTLEKLAPFDFKLDELEMSFKELDRDNNRWMAYSKAYEEWEANGAVKLGIELALDPLTYVGFGITTKILKPIPLVGKHLAAFNHGYMQFTDDMVSGVFKSVRGFPKTIAMKSMIKSSDIHVSLLNNFFRVSGKYIDDLGTKSGGELVAGWMKLAALLVGKGKLLGSGPIQQIQTTLMQSSSKRVIRPEQISGTALKLLRSDIITKVDDVTVTQFSDVQNYFNKALADDSDANITQTAQKLVEILSPGQSGQPRILKEMTGALRTWIADLRADMIKLTTPRGNEGGFSIVERVVKEAFTSEDDILRIPTQVLHEGSFLGYQYQKGIVSGMLSGVDATTRLLWTNWLEKKLIIPFSRAFLVFGAYGPFNLLEGIMKPLLEDLPALFVSKRFGFMGTKWSPKHRHDVIARGIERKVTELEGGAIVEQLGPIGDGDMGNIAERILALRISKNFDAYHWMVRMFGRIGLNQRADFMVKATHRELWRQDYETMQVLDKEFIKLWRKYPGIDSEFDGMMETILRDALTVDEATFRETVEIALRTIPEHRVEQVLKRFPDLGVEYRQIITEGVRSGEMFSNPKFFGNLREVAVNVTLRHPRDMSRRFDKLVAEFRKLQPQNYKELLNKFNQVLELTHLRQRVHHSIQKQADLVARGKSVADKDKMFNEVYEGLQDFLRTSNDSISAMTTQMKHHLEIQLQPPVEWGKVTIAKGLNRQRVRDVVNNLPLDLKISLKNIRITGGSDREIASQIFQEYLEDSILKGNLQPFAEYLNRTGFTEAAEDMTAQVFQVGARNLTPAGNARELMKRFRAKDSVFNIKRLADEFADYARASSKQDYIDISFDKDISWFIGDRPLDVKEVVDRARNQFDAFESIWPKRLSTLRGDVPNQDLIHVDNMIQLMDEYNVIYNEAFTKFNNFRTTHFANRPKNLKDKVAQGKFWDEYFYNKQVIFDDVEKVANDMLKTREVPISAFLARAEQPPHVMPALNGTISTNDVVQLLGGGSPQDLDQSVLSEFLQTLADKDTWIATIRGKANMMGKYHKIADEMIEQVWSEERIGQVYDRLVTQQFPMIQNAVKEYNSPLFQQIHDIEQEMGQVARLRGWDESRQNLIRQWVDDSANELNKNLHLQQIQWTKPSGIRTYGGPSKKIKIFSTNEELFDAGDVSEISAGFGRWLSNIQKEQIGGTLWDGDELREAGHRWVTTAVDYFPPPRRAAIRDNFGKVAEANEAYQIDLRIGLQEQFGDTVTVWRGVRLKDFGTLGTGGHEYINVTLNKDTAASFSDLSGAGIVQRMEIPTNEIVALGSGPESELIIHNRAFREVDTQLKIHLDREQSIRDFLTLKEVNRQNVTEVFNSLNQAITEMEGAGVHPTMVNSVRERLRKLYKADFEVSELPSAALFDFADALRDIEIPPFEFKPRTWRETRNAAYDDASKLYFNSFADYAHPTAVNQFMRSIFPYWTYEAHRWHWIMREAIRHPGTAAAWGKYMDYSDNGYIPLPFSDSMQFNPLRGTIFMGGMSRLMRRDFPEFQDNMPAIAEPIDMLGRFGFYPNVAIMGILQFIGPGDPRRRQAYSQVIPSTWMSILYGLQGIPGTDSFNRLTEILFPEPFRDYYTMLAAGDMIANNPAIYNPDEISAVDIWTKKFRGTKLLPSEQELWDKAFRASSKSLLLMNQAGVLRMQPKTLILAQQEVRELIEDWTGVSVERQEALNRRGMRYNDFIRKYLTLEQMEILNNLDAFKIWAGKVIPLLPSLEGRERVIHYEFWDSVVRSREDAAGLGIFHPETGEQISKGMEQIDADFRLTGNSTVWKSDLGDIQGALNDFRNILSTLPQYKDIPITREQREAVWAETGIHPLAWSPEEEILFSYYEVQVKEVTRFNEDVGRYEKYLDWDTFWAQRETILSMVKERNYEFYLRLINKIDKNLTELGRVFRQYSREWKTPYRGITQIVLETFTDEERSIIRSYRSATLEEQNRLRELKNDQGKIISTYDAKLTGTRKRWREVNPEGEAWMLFFGDVSTATTDEAWEIYLAFKVQHDIASGLGSE